MIGKTACYGALAAAVLVFGANSAGARTLRVGTCTTATTTYSTIQAAVDAAVDGDSVVICPGTYPEQVSVTKSISLKGHKDTDPPQIVVPAGGLVANTTMNNGVSTAAQILVAPSSPGTANVSNLVVDAADNNNTNCSLEMIGIYYKGAGGSIRKNTVQNQIGPVGYQNCQNGIGILVENTTVGTEAVTIANNRVQNFDKNGIVMGLPGSVGTIQRNTVTGLGPTTILAQNGIELIHGASANISSNVVSDFVYSPLTFGSSGIILHDVSSDDYQTPPTIQRNTVNNATFGIVLDGVNGTPGNMIQVLSNTVTDAGWAGIGLESNNSIVPAVNSDYIYVANNKISNTTIYDGIDVCGDNNTVTRNTVATSTNESAIHLDALCEQANGDPSGTGNTITRNRIMDACVGILSGPADGENTISGNTFVDVTNKTMFGSDDYSCSTPARAPLHGNRPKSHPSLKVAISP
jgi:hypothetical protein